MWFLLGVLLGILIGVSLMIYLGHVFYEKEHVDIEDES